MTAESRHAHAVATWRVRRTRLPLVRQRCPGCRADAFEASGKFRVNANGKLLDVWLLLRCIRCDRTTKATVIERSAFIDHSLLTRFEKNDFDLVADVLLDPGTAQKNRFSLDWGDAWEVITDRDVPCHAYPCSVRVTFADPIPVRPTQLIAQGLGVSRSRIKQLVESRRIELPRKLGARTSAAFEFTIMAECT